jgi:hypothetical protein
MSIQFLYKVFAVNFLITFSYSFRRAIFSAQELLPDQYLYALDIVYWQYVKIARIATGSWPLALVNEWAQMWQLIENPQAQGRG